MGATQGIRAGKAYIELGVSDKLTKGLKAAQQRLAAFGAGLRTVGTHLAAIGGAALGGLFGAAKTFANVGDHLDEMSARTGVSVEALSELGLAAELSGADLETLETGLRKMQRTIADAATGTDSAADALSRLGLNVADVVKLAPEQQFKLIAGRLSQIPDPTLRAASAMEVFGKSGTRLLPMLQDGAKGLEAFQEQARRLGLTVSTRTAKDAALLADALDILWRVLKQGVFVIGSALATTVRDLANALTRTVVAVTNWIKQNRELVVWVAKIAAVVAASGVALVTLGYLVSGIAAAFGTLATIASGVGTALGAIGAALAALLSPIGLVISAAVALGGTLLIVTDAGAGALAWLGEQFGRLRDTVHKVVGGIADALAAGDVALAAEVLWAALKLAWQKGANALHEIWTKVKSTFVQTVYDLWYGAQMVVEEVWHGLEIAWIESTAFIAETWTKVVAFLSRTWTDFTSDLALAWGLVQNWLTKRWLDLFALFGDLTEEQANAAKRMADEEFAADVQHIEDRRKKRQQEIADQRKADLAGRESRRKGEREKEQTTHEARLVDLARQWAEAERKVKEAEGQDLARAQAELEKAKKALDEAIGKAHARREAADTEGGPPRRKLGEPLADLEDRLAGLGDLVARKISVTGTFNPAAVHGLGGGDAVERTARASEQTAKHTKRLVDAAITGGLTFA